MTQLKEPPPGSISLDKQASALVITIQQSGFALLRIYMAIMLCLALWFLLRDMVASSWQGFVSTPSPLTGTWFLCASALGLLCIWMLFRAAQGSSPQRLVLSENQLQLDSGIPALRMISNGAPFDKKIMLAFPRRRELRLSKGQCVLKLERLKSGEKRLWLLGADQPIELAPFVTKHERDWLNAYLLEWQATNN